VSVCLSVCVSVSVAVSVTVSMYVAVNDSSSVCKRRAAGRELAKTFVSALAVPSQCS